jgi:hypothetical protein
MSFLGHELAPACSYLPLPHTLVLPVFICHIPHNSLLLPLSYILPSIFVYPVLLHLILNQFPPSLFLVCFFILSSIISCYYPSSPLVALKMAIFFLSLSFFSCPHLLCTHFLTLFPRLITTLFLLVQPRFHLICLIPISPADFCMWLIHHLHDGNSMHL